MEGKYKTYRRTMFVKFPLFILYTLVLFWAVWVVDRPEAEQVMRRWPAVCFAHLLLFWLLFKWFTARKPDQRTPGQLTAYRIAFGANELVFLALGCLVAARASAIVPIPALVWIVPVIHVGCVVWSIRTWTNVKLRNITLKKRWAALAAVALLLLLCLCPLPRSINTTLQGTRYDRNIRQGRAVTVSLQGRRLDYLLRADQYKLSVTVDGTAVSSGEAVPAFLAEEGVWFVDFLYYSPARNRHEPAQLRFREDFSQIALTLGEEESVVYVASEDPGAAAETLLEQFGFDVM